MKHFFQDFLGYWILKIIIAIDNLIPLRFALAISRTIGWICYLLHKRRSVAYANIKAALGDVYSPAEIRQIVRRMYMNVAETAVEMFRFKNLKPETIGSYVKVEGFERIRAALEKGKGLIFLTAHFGNWELSAITSALYGFPMKVLAREQKHSRLNDLLNEFRATHGNEIIGKGMALREIIQALKQNNIVGILSDQSGGSEGIYVPFFRRRTTTPPGVIGIAQRTGCVVLPSFIKRNNDGTHEILIHEPLEIPNTDDKEYNVRKGLENYLGVLEEHIRQTPDQWLWGHKRWKYTRDKYVAVLTDGKAGHEGQSNALCKLFQSASQEKNITLHTRVCNVEYKGIFHRMLLFVMAFMMRPWMQGRIYLLQFFLKADSFNAIKALYTDFVITCGAGTVPVGLFLAKECEAKKISIMKPPAPYDTLHYDMLVVPMHDSATRAKGKVVRMLTALNETKDSKIIEQAAILKQKIGETKNKVLSVFIGGDTQHYKYDAEMTEEFLRTIVRLAKNNQVSLLVTTSRRTREDIEDIVKRILSREALCALLVIANEKNIPNVVYGMMGLATEIIVTEDSISMISECVESGKAVFVVKMAEEGLSDKHIRFQQVLEEKGAIRLCAPSTVDERMKDHQKNNDIAYDLQRERMLVVETLKDIL